MSGLCGDKSSGPMCCWHLPLLVALVTTVLFLCIAQGNGVTGKRKPARRFQVDPKKILNKEFCVSGKDLMDGAFVEDLKGRKKGCQILLYDSVKTGKKSSETDPATKTPVTPPDIGQKNGTTAPGGTSENISTIPMSTAAATSTEEATMEIITNTLTTNTEETTTEIPRLILQWPASNDGQPISVGRGSFVRGELKANWQKMNISLLDKDNNTLLEFNVQNKERKALLEMKWSKPDGNPYVSPLQEIAILDENCNCFELYFELVDKGIKIMLNSTPLPQISEVDLKVTPEVKDIKMEGDINENIELNSTWTVTNTGQFFRLNRSVENFDVIKLNGKFFAKAKSMTIFFVYFKTFDPTMAETCMNTVSDINCSIDLEITIDLIKNAITLRKEFFDSLGGIKEWWKGDERKHTAITNQFVAGQKFELEVRASVSQEKNAQKPTYVIDQIQELDAFPRNKKFTTNYVLVSMDDGVLFDDPKIEDKQKIE